jgi:hypothetical protein
LPDVRKRERPNAALNRNRKLPELAKGAFTGKSFKDVIVPREDFISEGRNGESTSR